MKVVERKSPFIKQFGGAGDNEIVCFKFWQAVVASGCPGKCAYCFLPTQRPYITGRYDVQGTLFSNLRDIEIEARRWLRQQQQPAGLIVGENQDGLAFEGAYKNLLGVTPLELLIPLFEDANPYGHDLVVLSKFTSTSHAEALGIPKHTIFSWSLSLRPISERYEKGVASLRARLEKAAEMKARGFRIRFRLDALAPVENWEDELAWIVKQINDIQPEMLTIGALRASNPTALKRAAEKLGRDGAIFDFIETKDASNFKHRTNDEFHTAAFVKIREQLSRGIKLGLCKEELTLWQQAGVFWQGCHCLKDAEDLITTPRLHLIGRTASNA